MNTTKTKKITFGTILTTQDIYTGEKGECRVADALAAEEMNMKQTGDFVAFLQKDGNCVFRGIKYAVK